VVIAALPLGILTRFVRDPHRAQQWNVLVSSVLVLALLTLGAGELPSFCLFRALAGIDCPFCGGLRAAEAVLHGRVVAGWSLHPAGVLAVGWLLLQIPIRTAVLAGAISLSPGRDRRMAFVADVTMLALCVGRFAVRMFSGS
jgi:hypothetical protein